MPVPFFHTVEKMRPKSPLFFAVAAAAVVLVSAAAVAGGEKHHHHHHHKKHQRQQHQLARQRQRRHPAGGDFSPIPIFLARAYIVSALFKADKPKALETFGAIGKEGTC